VKVLVVFSKFFLGVFCLCFRESQVFFVVSLGKSFWFLFCVEVEKRGPTEVLVGCVCFLQ